MLLLKQECSGQVLRPSPQLYKHFKEVNIIYAIIIIKFLIYYYYFKVKMYERS